MDEGQRSLFDLPRWVADRNDERAGFIHLAADGLWRANNWSGFPSLEPSRPPTKPRRQYELG